MDYLIDSLINDYPAIDYLITEAPDIFSKDSFPYESYSSMMSSPI